MTAALEPTRRAAIEARLAAWGWGGAGIAPLAADASFRRYWRVERNGAGAVLMDAPSDKEDLRPFVAIARHLSAHRFSAPAILACAESAGLVLLEDLGDRKFTSLLAAGHDPLELCPVRRSISWSRCATHRSRRNSCLTMKIGCSPKCAF